MRLRRFIPVVMTLTAAATLVADGVDPHSPPRNFICQVEFNEIGEFHRPKGGYAPITVRNGMLVDIDLSPHPDYPVGTDHLRYVKSLDISHTVEHGAVHAKAFLAYAHPRRAEMELKLKAFLGTGTFTFKGTEIKRRYGVYSSISDPEVKLQEEEITTFFFTGTAQGWKNGKFTFKGPYRRVIRNRRYTGSTGWRESEPRITETIRTKYVEPIDRSGPEDSPPWHHGAFLKAFGAGNRNLRDDLERVDAFFRSTAKTAAEGNFDLARKQIDQLALMLADLRQNIQKASLPVTVQVFRLPTGEVLDQIRELQRLELELQELHQRAYAHVDQLIRDIEDAKHNFSGNVMKGMFRSYVTWSGALPSDPADGLAGYSLSTSVFHLPRSLKGMLDRAEKDSDFLANQVEAIRAMQALQAFWEEVRDHAVSEHRRLEAHLKSANVNAALELHQHAADALR